MSVCNEGWPEDKFHHEECPALDFMYEGLGAEPGNEEGRWEPHCKMGVFCSCEHHNDKLPGSCPHASALKTVVENPELVLVAQPKDCSLNCRHYDRGYKGPCDLKQKPNRDEAGDYCDKWQSR